MIKLSIDTSNRTKSIITLEAKGEMFNNVIESNVPHSEKILEGIERICWDAKIDPKAIDQIEVGEGPGSFTGLRVGIAIANTLGFALGITINGKKVGTLAEPVYS